MRGVVGWLHPDSRFAFQRQVHQTHRTHRTQGIIFADVASPDRVEKPEPQVVAEPEEEDGVERLVMAVVVSAGIAGVRVASVAKPSGAESRVVLEVDEEGGLSAIGVQVWEGKRIKVDDRVRRGRRMIEWQCPLFRWDRR